MGHIRDFTPADIPAIAQLWLRCFRKLDKLPSVKLQDCFNRVFFANPCRIDGINSLVYAGSDGQVIGFMGVIPRRMRFRQREVTVAVATQLMVDSSKRRGLAAVDLARRLFQGPQILTYSDGAVDISRRLWVRCGGEEAKLYCLEWTRLLHPLEYRVSQSQKTGPAARLARGLRPLWKMVDWLCGFIPEGSFRPPRSELQSCPLQADDYLKAIKQFPQPESLQSDWDDPAARWALALAAEGERYGKLQLNLVTDSAGAPLGCWAAYLGRGKVAQALHLAARPGMHFELLQHLLAQASKLGCLGVNGMVRTSDLLDYGRLRCQLLCRDLGVLFQTRDRELALAIHSGDAALSRLDGEWFLPLGINRGMDW